jgi:hypothetical protein
MFLNAVVVAAEKHRNLKSRSRIEPWKVKRGSVVGGSDPRRYLYRILCHGKYGRENSIFDAQTLALLSPFVLGFRFLCGKASLETGGANFCCTQDAPRSASYCISIFRNYRFCRLENANSLLKANFSKYCSRQKKLMKNFPRCNDIAKDKCIIIQQINRLDWNPAFRPDGNTLNRNEQKLDMCMFD